MKKVIILGAGKIGSLMICLLCQSLQYQVTVADKEFSQSDIKRIRTLFPDLKTITLDVTDYGTMQKYLKEHQFDAMVSCLPFFCNEKVAYLAQEFSIHYFDLTEDVTVTNTIKQLSKEANNLFVPQCGLAPGFVGIAANSLAQQFEKLESIKLRVGALPQNVSNKLFYSLTWSTEGLINEYINPCHAIRSGKGVYLHPMQGVENAILDGVTYEAFNTSGGLGSLVELYEGKVDALDYKTLRYPGHREKMHFLLRDLKLRNNVKLLKEILEHSIPKTYKDLVIVYVSVIGKKDGALIEDNFFRKIYPAKIADHEWSAIQVTTASSLCVVLDIVLTQHQHKKGFFYQEQISLTEFLNNQFARYYSDLS